VIQLGKRSTLCTLLAVAALSVSASALAQTPAPTPPADPAAPSDPNNPPPPPAEPAPPPAPAPAPAAMPAVPAAAEPPKVTFPTMAGPMLRLSELFAIRPGIFFQFWAAAAQDQFPQADGESGEWANNMYLRRARFYLLGTVGKSITWFMLWESANLGLAGGLDADGTVNKNFTQLNGAIATFPFNDAWLDFKVNNTLSLQAGLMLIPYTRNILQSTATYWAIDIAAVSASYINVTETNTLRDLGVQAKVTAAQGKLEARALVSQGVKLPDVAGGGRAAGKNSPRLTGYLQYNFFEPEAGYVFNGQYFGKKKVAGIALGGDYQSIDDDNPYFATSATLFASIPLKGADPKNGGDEFGGQLEYLHFHGGGNAPGSQATFLGKRNGLMAEVGYYNKKAKLSVFGKFEGVFFDGFLPVPTAAGIVLLPDGSVNDTRLYGVGLKYFVAEAACNLTLQYSLTQWPNQPDMMPARSTGSTIQAQLQLGYF
jgi:hypothetical protein